MKLIGTHQHLFYNDLNILGARIRTVKEETEAAVSNEIGLELNDKKIK